MEENHIENIELLKAISEPNRLEILRILSAEDICVCELAKRMNIKHNLISFHFKILFEAGILDKERAGNKIFYRIKPEKKAQIEYLFKFLNFKINQ